MTIGDLRVDRGKKGKLAEGTRPRGDVSAKPVDDQGARKRGSTSRRKASGPRRNRPKKRRGEKKNERSVSRTKRSHWIPCGKGKEEPSGGDPSTVGRGGNYSPVFKGEGKIKKASRGKEIEPLVAPSPAPRFPCPEKERP